MTRCFRYVARFHLICFGGLLIAVSSPTRADAGAWLQPEGRGYLRLSYFGMDTSSRFDESGARTGLFTRSGGSRPVEYGDREIRGYAELGVSDRVTAYGSLAWKRVRNTQPTAVFETTGPGDLHAGARYGLARGRVPLSVAFELKIPTAYDETDAPALGAGAVDGTARALIGTSWGWGYTTADAGYGVRGGGYRDELLLSGEVGSRFAGPLYGRTVARGVYALGSGSTSGAAEREVFDPGLASPRSLVFSGTLGVDVGRGLAIEATFEHAAGGRDALSGNGLELALAYSGFALPR
jgi:hypothetical protein